MRTPTLLLALLLLTGCSGESMEPGVPPAITDHAEAPALPWLNRAGLDAWLRFNVWNGSRSGFVALFARDGVPIYANAVGWADIDSGRPMALDTRMRFASMTKPVTAVAALILWEQGRLDLDDPVADYIPSMAGLEVATGLSRNSEGGFDTQPLEQPLRVLHLLLFASGVGTGINELHGNPNLVTGTLHGAFDDRVHVELGADFAQVLAGVAVFVNRSPGNDAERPDVGQAAQQVVVDAVGEILVVRIAAAARKRQYSDGIHHSAVGSCQFFLAAYAGHVERD